MSYDPIVHYKRSATGKNPRLLWRTVFGSGVTKAASDEADGISFFEDLSGTDSVTGFDYNADLKTALACGHIYPAVQAITDRTSKKVGGASGNPEYTTEVVNTIETSTSGIAGANDLSQSIILRSVASFTVLQSQFGVYRYQSALGGDPDEDMEEFFIKKTIKLPSDMQALLMANGYNFNVANLTLFEYKTGWYNNDIGCGDGRLVVQVRQNQGGTSGSPTISGNPYFVIKFDTGANNGTGGLTRPPSTSTAAVMNYWTSGTAITQAVPVDEYFDLLVYVKRPKKIFTRDTANQSTSDFTVTNGLYSGATVARYVPDQDTGITWLGMRTDSGGYETLYEKIGGVQMGSENLGISRLFLATAYGSFSPTYTVKTTDIQIWNTMPMHLQYLLS